MNVFVADEQADAVDVAFLRHLALAVLESEGCPDDTEVSVMLVGDEEMSGYNRRFMGKDGTTDVLSFPIESLVAGRPPTAAGDGPPPLLGDVVLDPSHIRRQADSLGVDYDDELALLMVHGLLHLLGYDHEADDDADRMETRERELLEAVGRRRR